MRRYNATDLILRKLLEEERRQGTFTRYQPEFEEDGRILFRGVGGAFFTESPTGVSDPMSWRELQAAQAESRYRMREVFRAEVRDPTGRIVHPGDPFPGSGWYRYPALEQFARDWAAYVHRTYGPDAIPELIREGWGLENASAAQALLDSLQRGEGPQNFFGLPVIDDDTASVLRLGFRRGEHWEERTMDEVMDFLHTQYGFHVPGGKNPAKRLKALMSMRGLGAMESGKAFKVGILRHRSIEEFRSLGLSLEDAKELAKTGLDGSSMVRESVIQQQLAEMDKQADALLRAEGDSGEAEIARRRGQAMKREIAKIRKDVKAKRVFGNARIMGLQVWDIEEGGALSRVWQQGQIKGDVRVISDAVADRIAEGIEIFTGIGNVKQEVAFGITDRNRSNRALRLRQRANDIRNNADKELRSGRVTETSPRYQQMLQRADAMDERAARFENELITATDRALSEGKGIARFFTLEPHKAHGVHLDYQSLSSFPEFFDPDVLEQTMLGDFEKLISDESDGLENLKRAMQGMADDFEERLSNDRLRPSDPKQLDALEKAAAFARQFRERLEYPIDPRERADVMRQVLTSFRAHLTKTKRGVLIPRFRIPDARSAGIITTADADALPRHLRNMREGMIGYNAQAGTWVFNTRTWAELVDTFGGADLDDTLINMLRLDEEGQLRAVLFRQPNSLAEFAVLGVDPTDTWVEEALEAKGVQDIGGYQAASREIKGTQRQILNLEAKVTRLRSEAASKQFNPAVLRQRIAALQVEVDVAAARFDELVQLQATQFQGRTLTTLDRQRRILEQARAQLRDAQEQMAAGVVDAEWRARQVDLQLGKARGQLSTARGNMASWLKANGGFETINLKRMMGIDPETGQAVTGNPMIRAFLTDEELARRGDAAMQFYVGHDRRINIMKPAGGADAVVRWRPQDIKKRLEAFIANRGALGMYSNWRMVLDSHLRAGQLTDDQIQMVERFASQTSGLRYHKRINVLLHERAIDASIQASGIQVGMAEGMEDLLALAQQHDLDNADAIMRGETVAKVVRDRAGDVTGLRLTLGEIQSQAMRQMIDNIVAQKMAFQAAGLDPATAPGFDPEQISKRLKKSGSFEEAAAYFSELQGRLGFDFGFEDIIMEPTDPRAQTAMMASRHRGMLKTIFGEELFDAEENLVPGAKLSGLARDYIQGRGVPEIVGLQAETDALQHDAQRLLERYRQLMDEHTLGGANVYIDPELEDLRSRFLPKYDWGAIEAGMLEELKPFLDEGAIPGEKVVGEGIYKRLWALMAEINRTGRHWQLMNMSGPGASLGRLFDRAQAFAMLRDENLDLATRQELEIKLGIAEGPLPADEFHGPRRLSLADLNETQEHRNRLLGLVQIEDAEDRAAMGRAYMDAGLDSAVGSQAEVYSRLSRQVLERANTASGRMIMAGVAALTALGLVKLARDREVSPEEALGPTPQLPGGAPYLGPTAGGFDFESGYINPPNRGVAYDIYARGANPETFLRETQWLTGADTVQGNFYEGRDLTTPANLLGEVMQMLQ